MLAELLAAEDAKEGAELSGTQIREKTDLASGTLSPMMTRLRELGVVVWRWENVDPATVGRPRRKLYRLRRRAIPLVRDYVQS